MGWAFRVWQRGFGTYGLERAYRSGNARYLGLQLKGSCIGNNNAFKRFEATQGWQRVLRGFNTVSSC